jgi:hypothetical protein
MHPAPRHLAEQQSTTVRRVNLVDRAALRLGLMLVTWGRRSSGLSREQLVARHAQLAAREQREQLAERRLRMTTPRL